MKWNRYPIYLKRFIINHLIRGLAFCVRKNPHLWVLGMDDGGGVKFSGNIWYFFAFLIKNQPHITPIIISSSLTTQETVKQLGGICVAPDTLKAAWYALFAKVYIVAGELGIDITNFILKDTLKIHLWHGVPLKKIYYSSKKTMERKRQASLRAKLNNLLIGPPPLEIYDFIACTSINLKPFMEEAFNNKHVFVTGQPREDIFYKPLAHPQLLEEIGFSQFTDHIFVVYLPTFRDVRKVDRNYYLFANTPKIQEYLKANNIIVIQKNHNSSLKKRLQIGNIFYLPEDIDTQKLLLAANILITDYSSVYIDFLHLDRPIIFYAYDLLEYITHDRELYFDYNADHITPGPKVTNENELLTAIQKYHINGSLDAQKRSLARNFFHDFTDGQASTRIYQGINRLLYANAYKQECSLRGEC